MASCRAQPGPAQSRTRAARRSGKLLRAVPLLAPGIPKDRGLGAAALRREQHTLPRTRVDRRRCPARASAGDRRAPPRLEPSPLLWVATPLFANETATGLEMSAWPGTHGDAWAARNRCSSRGPPTTAVGSARFLIQLLGWAWAPEETRPAFVFLIRPMLIFSLAQPTGIDSFRFIFFVSLCFFHHTIFFFLNGIGGRPTLRSNLWALLASAFRGRDNT